MPIFPSLNSGVQAAPPAVGVKAAEVSVGKVTNSDIGLGTYPSVMAADPGLHPDYDIYSRYVKDRHRWYGGVSSPGGFQGNSAVVFQLAAPKLFWICYWTGLKVGYQPKIPDIVPVDPKWVLIDEEYTLHNVDTAGNDFSPLYRISGVYMYGHLSPDPETLNNARFGIPPYLANVFDRTMPVTLRTANLIDGTATSKIPGLGTVGLAK
jgi:hypothetical protein